MWQLNGESASFNTSSLLFHVNLASGDRSLLVQAADAVHLAELWTMPAISKQRLIDCYVRGRDLVCVLEPSKTFPFYTELYWTLRDLDGESNPIVTVSLQVSVRTDLLDTHPAIEVISRGVRRSHSAVEVAGGPAYVVPLGEQVTLIDFATPEDCATQSVGEAKEGLTLKRMLFDHFLEKGVIRRGRLFAAFFHDDVETSLAVDTCRDMLAAELPLTT